MERTARGHSAPKPGHAISEYHDVKKIYAQLDNLLAQPIRPLKREAMDNFLTYLKQNAKRPKR